MKFNLAVWKHPVILLSSVGIAGIGDFIYLVAINILVYQMTGSAAAVASLWVIGPVVNVLTKFWTGSFIDFRSKRKIMIVTYIARAITIFCIPFLPNIWLIFLFLVFLSIAKSFFTPSSITYIAQLVPKTIRKRYNSIQSLTTSGAFIIGPAIGGALILLMGVDYTLIINSLAFIMAAILLSRLPDKEIHDTGNIPALSFAQIKSDWIIVIQFIKENKYIAFIYSAFLATTIFSFAMDAQEVVFTQKVVGLSEMEYSLLISITGIGAIVGAFIVTLFSKNLSIRYLIAIGIMMETVGFLLYAFSWSFLSITVGFIILGFFNAFLNAGITTFYQNNVPTEMMGRVTSMFQLFLSLLQIVFVLMVGAIADIIPLRITIITLAVGMLVIACLVIVSIFLPAKKLYFKES